MYDQEGMPRMGNGCTSYALTLKFLRGGKETWVFLQAGEGDGSYSMTVSEREAMKQDVAVNELADKLAKDGFIALYVNFDTGKATIKPDSARTLDDAAAALKAAAALRVEVAGHTDNVGAPERTCASPGARALGRARGARHQDRPDDREGLRTDDARGRQPHGGRTRQEPARGTGQEVAASTAWISETPQSARRPRCGRVSGSPCGSGAACSPPASASRFSRM
ncbi:MAG: OmpA family protein [Acidobacteria bacterium]|nr:OmpA family protein [Acidobacteriota bacterium]